MGINWVSIGYLHQETCQISAIWGICTVPATGWRLKAVPRRCFHPRLFLWNYFIHHLRILQARSFELLYVCIYIYIVYIYYIIIYNYMYIYRNIYIYIHIIFRYTYIHTLVHKGIGSGGFRPLYGPSCSHSLSGSFALNPRVQRCACAQPT